jgi:hypothetical protein
VSTKQPKAVIKFLREIGSKGGKIGGKLGGPARAEALTPERRVEIARKAAAARWDKGKKEPE